MAEMTLNLDDRPGGRFATAFETEASASLARAARVRLAVLLVVAIWITIENGFPNVLFYYPFFVVFAVIGFAPPLLKRLGLWATWQLYLAAALDLALITVVVLLPNPLDEHSLPLAWRLHWSNEFYLFVIIAGAVFTYSPRLVFLTSVFAAAIWALGVAWIAAQPEPYVGMLGGAQFFELTEVERLAYLGDPDRINPITLVKQIIVFLIVGGVLAVAVKRARGLVFGLANTERERANLARYFSPNMVEELAAADEPLAEVRRLDVAVLFVDIVGFTAISAAERPEAVIALLREFHARMVNSVFAHRGTLDKYLGDGVMATFGTPRPGASDAAHAMGCARAMVEDAAAWSAERERGGEPPVKIAIGVHYGPVVLGDIGGANRLEYAVIGDTVNVASRLERLTRALGVDIIASEQVIEQARRQGLDEGRELLGFERGDPQELEGRPGSLPIWTYRSQA